MATFDYSKMENVAENLLEKFGKDCILQKVTGTVYNPETKKNEKQVEEHKGICVKQQYSAEMVGGLSNIINMGDVNFICRFEESGVVPAEGKDSLVFDGVKYNVLHVYVVAPSGNPIIIYKLHSRRVN